MSTIRTDNIQTTDNLITIPVSELATQAEFEGIEEEINQRTIYVGSVAELLEIDAPVDGLQADIDDDGTFMHAVWDDDSEAEADGRDILEVPGVPVGRWVVIYRAPEPVSGTYKRPVQEASIIPEYADGSLPWNAVAHIQDNLTTAEISGEWYQFCVFVATGRVPYIAKRRIHSKDWETFDLSGVSGNPLSSPIAQDSHNTINIGVDSEGYIHVSGNHHNDPLRYIRSTSPGDITGWTAPGMTGANEASVTYPRFLNAQDGTLLFFYRDGGSGDGALYLNTYDTSTQTWSATHHPLIDGEPSGENPYLWNIPVSEDGGIHLAWCWRATPDPDTNSDLSYMVSHDNGATWEQSDGSSQSIPATRANSDIILPTSATGSGLINQCGMDCDNNNSPHIAVFLSDGAGVTQIHHVWKNGESWNNDQITDFSTSAFRRPSVFCPKSGGAFIIYNHPYDRKKGALRCINVSSVNDPGEYPEFKLVDIDPGNAEVGYDTQRLKLRNELSFLFHPTVQGTSGFYNPDGSCWDRQVPIIASYDLSRIDELISGLVSIPSIRTIKSGEMQGLADITANSFSGFPSPRVSITSDLLAQGLLFARYQAFSRILGEATGLSITLREVGFDPGTATSAINSTYGEFSTASYSSIATATPWMPLIMSDLSGMDYYDGFLQLEASVEPSGEGGQIARAGVQVGILDLG